ncbi:MAG: hypothetical protein AAGF33_08370 [Pseudomonadota bacterium]
MGRLLIVIPVYLLLVGWLAQWPPIQPFFLDIARIPQQQTLILSAIFLLAAAGWLTLASRRLTAPNGFVRVINQGAIGIAFGCVYNLFDGTTGRAITLNFAIIVAVAFAVSEIVYLTVQALLQQRRPNEGAGEASSQGTGEQQTTNGLRLAVTIPVYVFVLVFLPRNDDYRRIVEPFNAVLPQTVLMISAIALVAAGALVVAISAGKIAIQPIQRQTLFAGSIGLGFGAAINLFGYFTGLGVSISDLILVPVGFMAAELVFLALQWRLQNGPPEP